MISFQELTKLEHLTGFIRKLYLMIEDPDNSDQCCWGNNGHSLLIKDVKAFKKDALKRYFKRVRFASFHRQLNKYGFLQESTQQKNMKEFKHPYFIRKSYKLLAKMKKRKKGQRVPETAPAESEIDSLYEGTPSRDDEMSMYGDTDGQNVSCLFALNNFSTIFLEQLSLENETYLTTQTRCTPKLQANKMDSNDKISALVSIQVDWRCTPKLPRIYLGSNVELPSEIHHKWLKNS